jgi:hypothetical protein
MRSSARVAASAAALIAIATGAPRAHAQACCGAATAVSPGRLTMAESFLVGGLVRVQHPLGTYDENRTWTRSPPGASEWDTEADLFATARFARKGQVTLVVPLVETWKSHANPNGDIHSHGGGLGDVRVAGRWDFTRAGASKTIPGIAVLAGLTFPTGRAAEQVSADDYLGASATGRGAYTGALGVGVEQTFGPWLVLVQALVSRSLTRHVSVGGGPTVASQMGTIFTTTAALAYGFDNDAAIGGLLTYELEGDATDDGVHQPGTGQAMTTTGLAWTYPLSDAYRLAGSLTTNLPANGFGRNRVGGPAMSVTFLRAW